MTRPRKNPFGPGPTPSAKSEEKTPPTGTNLQEVLGPPSDESMRKIGMAMTEVAALRARVLAAEKQRDEARALLDDATEGQKALTSALDLAMKSSGMTKQDEKALFDMCAEIAFDRTRDGNSFVVTLKGRRSHTMGKVGRFPNFAALLQHLRTRV